MRPTEQLEEICHAIASRLKELAQERSRGAISEESFVQSVLEIEAGQLRPGGFTLVASNTLDNWIVFKIKINGTSETCAAFEFLPGTDEFRRVSSECDA